MAAGRKKVLVVTSTLPRWQDDTEPRFVEYLAFELARHFDVVVLAPRCPGAVRDETLSHAGQSVRVHRFRYFFAPFESLAYEGGILSRLRRNPLRLFLVPFFIAAQLFSIRKLQRTHEFDAVHAHWIIPQGLVMALLKTLSPGAPPVMVTAHGSDLFALRGRLMIGLKRWILTKTNKLTVVSEAMRSHAVDLGCDENKLAVRSMGVDLRDRFSPGDSATVREGLIFVGRLVDMKGVRFLIEATSRLIDRFPDLSLTVIGDGPHRDELADLAKRHHLEEQVRFIGSVRNTDVPAHLRRAQIAVMPSSEQEGFGLVAIEAMGCGCAVVASDLPAVRDTVIDGETGLTAKPGDPRDLADKIAMLLSDAALLGRLAKNGRQHALQHFDWRHVGDRYAELIRGML